MSMLAWFGVALLGGAGAVARFLIERLFLIRFPGFPAGTLLINLSGSFTLGLLDGLAVTGTELTLIGTATIGAYTTFSAWMVQAQRLREAGAARAALIYVVVSLVVGYGAVALGQLIGA